MTDHCLEITNPQFPEIYITSSPDLAIYSHKVGAMKPEPAIYDAVPTTGFDTIIFIDDKADYIEEAVRRGWIGIHYTGHVDPHEALRAIKGHDKLAIDAYHNIPVAKNAQELEQVLKQYGVR